MANREPDQVHSPPPLSLKMPISFAELASSTFGVTIATIIVDDDVAFPASTATLQSMLA